MSPLFLPASRYMCNFVCKYNLPYKALHYARPTMHCMHLELGCGIHIAVQLYNILPRILLAGSCNLSTLLNSSATEIQQKDVVGIM